jgi:hypothetical protein
LTVAGDWAKVRPGQQCPDFFLSNRLDQDRQTQAGKSQEIKEFIGMNEIDATGQNECLASYLS